MCPPPFAVCASGPRALCDWGARRVAAAASADPAGVLKSNKVEMVFNVDLGVEVEGGLGRH